MKTLNIIKSILIVIMATLFLSSSANNLTIDSVKVIGAAAATTKQIEFKIGWAMAWRMITQPSNHDAVWVFVKYKDCGSNRWTHVKLNPSAAAHSADFPLEVWADTSVQAGKIDSNGVFVRLSRPDTSCTISNKKVTLEMNNLAPGEHDYRVFGIEMVYIPRGNFYLGDGGATNTFKNGNTNNPFLVTKEFDTIQWANLLGRLYSSGNVLNVGLTAAIPAAFPKGYAEVYCMKYEVSQGQYVDFLNTISIDQAATRAYTGGLWRNTISGNWPNYASVTPDRANNYMCWADLCAYLDWACLRPMTEFEYEKICRGPINPVQGEFAWGTNLIQNMTTVVLDGTTAERCTDAIPGGYGAANYVWVAPQGPYRVGIFSSTTTSRREAGATYYGVMEMTGNIDENVISIYSGVAPFNQGVNFTRKLGNGELSFTPTPGYTTQTSWTNGTLPDGTGAADRGVMFKGGGCNSAAANCQVSARLGGYNYNRAYNTGGGRGVR
ncbi:MAG: hypothetical protein A2X12_05545 [Bacteroidetes bacterium GWE2_29_8]|nr:MAG: hypothetical protein A2X12_05545 [Bacteroidetes bacterium GWE2_29_8]